MSKIKVHYFVGDVHTGGHDVHLTAKVNLELLRRAGIFEPLVICDGPAFGDMNFDNYFMSDYMEHCDAFIFNCGNYRFNTREEQSRLERAVYKGAGFIFLHGDHPCYWQAAGNVSWEGLEEMVGLVWRELTTHGDYGDHLVTIEEESHPITQGLCNYKTRDELFCNLENPHNVPYQVLASAYSDPMVLSRHGLSGTGNQEPTAIVRIYGEGRVYNQILGHVWPYYTGHGIGENTLLSYAPIPFRKMFVRGCEWAATGTTERTKDFDGAVSLRNLG